MAHDDGRRGQGADDRGVVVDDLVDGKALEGVGVAADVFRRAAVDAGPPGRKHVVPSRGEVGNPVFPAERRHPEPMDENNTWFGSHFFFVSRY